nr:MAG TPA: hypothetical protein [Caudoviricetes sp.]
MSAAEIKKPETSGQYGGKAMPALWPKGPRQWVCLWWQVLISCSGL